MNNNADDWTPPSFRVGGIYTDSFDRQREKGALVTGALSQKKKPLSHFLHGHPKDFFSPGRLTFESYPVLDATMGGGSGEEGGNGMRAFEWDGWDPVRRVRRPDEDPFSR